MLNTIYDIGWAEYWRKENSGIDDNLSGHIRNMIYPMDGNVQTLDVPPELSELFKLVANS